MDAIGDEADGGAGVGQQSAGQTGLAVSEGRHCVKQVRAIADARVEATPGLVIGRIAVAGADDHAARLQGW